MKILVICLVLVNFVSVNSIVRCGAHDYDCDSHQKCIPFAYHCNGIEDCVDKTDEAGCTTIMHHDENLTGKIDVTSRKPSEKSTEKLRSKSMGKAREIDEVEGNSFPGEEDSSNVATYIIFSIVMLLVATLLVLLILVYRKVHYRKPVINSFDNPIYHQTTEDKYDNDETRLDNF